MVSHTDADGTYRRQLLAQRDRLLRLRSDLEESTSDESTRWDAATLMHLEATAQLDTVEARLDATEAALSRHTTGQFGLCVECGDAIPAERLEARPEAHLCVPCCRQRRRSA